MACLGEQHGWHDLAKPGRELPSDNVGTLLDRFTRVTDSACALGSMRELLSVSNGLAAVAEAETLGSVAGALNRLSEFVITDFRDASIVSPSAVASAAELAKCDCGMMFVR